MTIAVYLAGPLFTHAEKHWNLALAEALRVRDPHPSIFLPQTETAPALARPKPDFRAVRDICLRGIDACDVVLAVLDGADSDSGTCFECGYAFARGIPIVGVRTDVRGGEDQGLNAMLSQSCDALISFPAGAGERGELDDLAEKIAVVLRTMASGA